MERIVKHLRGHFVAYLALFFALGGTSFAAVQALPRNSVGSPQIKNRSIQRIDISNRAAASLRGQRGPRGLTGAQGAQGIQGAKGDKGDKGDTGPRGPSDAKVARRDTAAISLAGGPPTTLMTLPVEAGSYAISGSVTTKSVGASSLTAGCWLNAGSDEDKPIFDTYNGTQRVRESLFLVHTFDTAGAIKVLCNWDSYAGATPTFTLERGRILATQAAAVSSVVVTG
jgi:Collagen triple helix repeat (20 copies)